MKKFVIIMLVCVLTVLALPVSAASELDELNNIDTGIVTLNGSGIVPYADVTYNAITGFGIQNMKAYISLDYTAKSNFSYASAYFYIQKFVNNAWVNARSDIQSSWHDTSYDPDDFIEHTLSLTSTGRYRGKIIGYIYGNDNTKDKIDSVKEQTI